MLIFFGDNKYAIQLQFLSVYALSTGTGIADRYPPDSGPASPIDTGDPLNEHWRIFFFLLFKKKKDSRQLPMMSGEKDMPIRVVQTELFGKIIVAAKDIMPGEQVSTEKATISCDLTVSSDGTQSSRITMKNVANMGLRFSEMALKDQQQVLEMYSPIKGPKYQEIIGRFLLFSEMNRDASAKLDMALVRRLQLLLDTNAFVKRSEFICWCNNSIQTLL